MRKASELNILHKYDLIKLEAQVHGVLALAHNLPQFLVHDAVFGADLSVPLKQVVDHFKQLGTHLLFNQALLILIPA